MTRFAIVKRLKQLCGEEAEFFVAGTYWPATSENDVHLVAGQITEAWWAVPLPPCPDCGGDLGWCEAGMVPGARKCLGKPTHHSDEGEPYYDPEGGCGSLFTVETEDGSAGITHTDEAAPGTAPLAGMETT